MKGSKTTAPEWAVLVKGARADPGAGLQRLFDTLRPLIKSLALRFASQIPDDAVQAAEITVWRNLDKIDVDREGTIQHFLIQAAVWGIRSEVTLYLRQHKEEKDPKISVTADLDALVSIPAPAGEDESLPEIPEFFEPYLQHIRDTGDFHGAHRTVADQMGKAISTVTTKYHAAVREFKRGIEK